MAVVHCSQVVDNVKSIGLVDESLIWMCLLASGLGYLPAADVCWVAWGAHSSPFPKVGALSSQNAVSKNIYIFDTQK
jgi:hypothetical protein